MRRRKFLGVLFLGIASIVAGFVLFYDFDETVERIIQNDTRRLKIDKGAIKKYLREAKGKKVFERFNFTKREFIRGHYFLSNELFTLPYYSKYTQYRSEIVGNFLLSTDFFNNKMDPGKTVHYTSFYDPYFRPCAHPFSNLYYS